MQAMFFFFPQRLSISGGEMREQEKARCDPTISLPCLRPPPLTVLL
jgi:hypothetical protein